VRRNRRYRLGATMDQQLKRETDDAEREIEEIADESTGVDVTKPDMPEREWMKDVRQTKKIVEKSTGINVDKPDPVEEEYLEVERQEQALVDDVVGPGAADATNQNVKMSRAERRKLASRLVRLAEQLVD